VLYSPDRGRANFPVNILLALELVKHIFDYTYTDEIFLDPYHFNYQIMFALGERNLAPRTFTISACGCTDTTSHRNRV